MGVLGGEPEATLQLVAGPPRLPDRCRNHSHSVRQSRLRLRHHRLDLWWRFLSSSLRILIGV